MAAGGPLTYIDRLIGCAQLRGYSVTLLSQSSLSGKSLLGYPIVDTLCVVTYVVPSNGPNLCLSYKKFLSWDSAFTPRRLSVVCIHPQRVVAIDRRNVTHTEVPIADWALVSLD